MASGITVASMLHLLSRPFAWLDEWWDKPWYGLYVTAYCVVGVALFLCLAFGLSWLLYWR